MAKRLILKLLGQPKVLLDDVSIEGLPGKAAAILYYLAATGQPQARTTLAGLLWGDLPESSARANLRRALVDLRQALNDYLLIGRTTVGLNPASNIWIDVVEFERQLDSSPSPFQPERVRAAIELYRGDFLDGFFLRGTIDFEAWAAAERERLRNRLIDSLRALAQHYADAGNLPQAIAEVRRLLALEPWREEAHRQLMRLLAQDGQRSAALAQFETCRKALAGELAVEPEPETVALYERIRDGQLSGGAEEQGRGAEKSYPVAHSSPAPPHNLPVQPGELIGRENELAEINDLLADPDCRLLTLVGPGGIGKTRLSIEAARRALDLFGDGVFFVPLAGIDSANDILPRIATAVDPESYPLGQSAINFLPQLAQRDLALLLVLDNLEQLLPAGSETIETLLSQARRLKLIATSRETLNLRWEWRYDLGGLAYPANDTVDSTESYSAVTMLLRRMQQARRKSLNEAETQAAARICRLVGGMPLGIELAAAQAARFSCTAIAQALERNLDALVVPLRDLPERQRSLRASFEVSWANLSPEEQAVFRQLSLFRTSFTAEAAQAVAVAGPLQLISLLDKSLLRQVSPERYHIHEVLRHFAKAKLAENPEEQPQTLWRYRRYYTGFLREKIKMLEQEINLTENIAAFFTEIDNLWAGWIRVTGQDDAQEFASSFVRTLHIVRHAQFLLSSADESLLLEGHRQLLESRSSEVDVCLIDLIWTDALADYLLDLSDATKNESQHYFSVYIEHSTVAGRLVALPFWADLGLLYYRADLLAKYGFAEPPATWDELELMAAEIQAGERAEGRTNFWGFLWQGRNFEGLTCNALEWQVSHGGGRLIEPNGVITVNNPQTVAAFERAAHWVGTISPESVIGIGTGHEAANIKSWLDGNVAFMRSFFFERVVDFTGKGETGVSLLPRDSAGSASTLGGQMIAVSKYARHPQQAIELVRYATSHQAQLERVLPPYSWPPTIPSLYDNPDVVTVNPHLIKFKDSFSSQNIVVRPSKVCGKLYPQVSKAYSTAVHSILTGQVDAATAVADLEAKLVEITGFPTGPPPAVASQTDWLRLQ